MASSNKIYLGLIHIARAIATRCASPPDNILGYLSMYALDRPTSSNNVIAWTSITSLGCPSH